MMHTMHTGRPNRVLSEASIDPLNIMTSRIHKPLKLSSSTGLDDAYDAYWSFVFSQNHPPYAVRFPEVSKTVPFEIRP